ncbi:galactosylceramide sulfotransferase-like isoform X1 [Artemia franciscana]|uniref:galactosylceramide sulfotransferase-like isoform X1 n=1 Tax=Artemia franciscana TaxID=6661 RepID=UPI0032DA3235
MPEFLDNLKDLELVRINNVAGRNQMLFDLGFLVPDFDNEDKVKKFTDEVEKNFDLVMVVEKFEESMVLLKHLLCWDYKDFVFFKLNARKEESKLKLSADQADKLRRWLKADNFLYTRLRKVFEKKVKEFGYERMEKEKKKLSSARNQVIERCLSGKKNLTGDSLIEEMRKRPGCRLYTIGGYTFMDSVKLDQWKKADTAALKSLTKKCNSLK